MSDRYLIPGTACLRNQLGVADAAVLRGVEAKIVSIRDVEIARNTIPGEYNSAHLQSFHWTLFRDVYDWAGKFRTVDIGKGNVFFGSWRYLEDEVAAVLSRLEDDNWLTGLVRERFASTTVNSTRAIPSGRGTDVLNAHSFDSSPLLPGIAWTGPS